MVLENIILSKISQAQKTKKPQTKAVILLEMGHILRGEYAQEK
jgi:hypothetical protein